MNKICIITTVQPPTEATERFAAMKDWQLIVVGDQKTPHSLYNNRKDIIYMSPEQQEKMDKKLSDLIGWGCCQRRSMGFLLAYEMGVDILSTVDDDNIPHEDWGKNLIAGKIVDEIIEFQTLAYCFDPLSVTNHSYISHRGFPLELLHERFKHIGGKQKNVKIDIEASLWNGSPDTSQIEHYYHRETKCEFNPTLFPYISNKFGPCNSQNTFITKEALPYYFMYPGIQRSDDIFASAVVQAAGFKLAYTKPSVDQVRNSHNEMKNFRDEYYMHETMGNVFRELDQNSKDWQNISEKYLPKRAVDAFVQYQSHFE